MTTSTNMDDDFMQKVKGDTPLRRSLNRALNNFIGALHIPTYDRIKRYQFNDTLAAFATYVFREQHAYNYNKRELRIEECLKHGLPLTIWEQIDEESPAFWRLQTIDQEAFLEQTSPYF
jgi:hypothetical protein